MTDIAKLNLEIAHGLPTYESLDVPGYLHRLDAWANFVAAKTERWLPRING